MNGHLLHINLDDMLLLGLVFIGLAFAVLLWLIKGPETKANRFLGLALIVVSFCLIRIMGGQALPLKLSLAIGPLLYFYVRQLTQPDEQTRYQDFLHFVPALAELSLQLAGRDLSPGFTIFSAGIYLYLSCRAVTRFYNAQQFQESDRYRNHLKSVQISLRLLGIAVLLALGYGMVNLFFYRLKLTYMPCYLLPAAILIRMAGLSIIKPVTRPVATVIPATLRRSELKREAAWLKKSIQSGHYHRNQELTLNSLAEKLLLTTHELSRLINQGLKKSFNDFINEYRVAEVIKKMQDPAFDGFTLEGIAYDSGFNSPSTFHRAFKQLTGKTPAAYKKQLSSYNLTYGFQPAAVISDQVNRNYMFKNYLKIAWRNMRNNRGFTMLNVLGLATGMAVALLIGLWVFDQLAYDHFLPGYRQAYSVRVNYTDQHDGTRTIGTVAIPLADVLRTTVPGIQYVAEADMDDFQTRDLMVGENKLLVNGGTVAPDFLHVFQYPLLRGNVNEVLKDPFSIVLDESTAKSFFGNDNPIGKTIRIDNKRDVKVTGLMKDFPGNSSFQFHFLLPYSYAEQTEDWVKNARSQWDNSSFEIFVGLQPHVDESQVAARIKNLIYEHNPNVRSFRPEVFLYPLKDWHLRSDFKNGKVAGGFIDYVRMFGIIGLLVLLIACINFVNLSTARSEKRAREVGVRKAIGSNRRDLIFQFLTESILLTFIAFLLSIGIVQLALPQFNELTESLVRIPYGNPFFWGIMLLFVLVTGTLAGFRPAFYLSSFNPIKVLKGTIQTGKTATLPRKALVVLQFSCSVAFMISTVIVYQQIRYAKERPIGYNQERLITTFITKDLADHYDSFRNDLLSSGLVESVTKASSTVTNIGWHTNIAGWPGQTAGEQAINVGAIITDAGYFKTVGMKLLGGHDFSGTYETDAHNIIINETAVRRMGLKGPVGQLIDFNGIKGRAQIIGVIKDALLESPFKPVEPLVFTHGQFGTQVIYRLAKGQSPHTAIERIGRIFDRYNPAYPFTYAFVDEAYNHKFNLETLVGKLAGVFAGLAIFVSCLGLFGLAAYVAEQRTKEIAVRKVLGASILQMWLMLSSDFLLLVSISCVIATPIAWYFLHGWLQKYEYRINIGPEVFILCALATLLITIITISFQAIKAALANPVKSLRSE